MNRLFLAIAAMSLAVPYAFAQGPADDFPNRPIKFVVPGPAGGPTDIMARVYADRMSRELGQPIVIDNKPGGNTIIAAQQVIKSAPDGYTIFAAMQETMAINPSTFASLPYRPLEDFSPISITAYNTSILIVPASGPKTVDELIAVGKANPGKLNYGAGIVTTRLAGYLFTKLAGMEATFVPYRGSPEVVQALLTGSIQYAVDGIAAAYPLIQSGQIRALAKTNDRPLATLPDLQPLSKIANMPDFGNISTWAGIVAPAGTPNAVIEKLQRSISIAASDPVVVQKLLPLGIGAASSTPAEFTSYTKEEIARWAKIIGESGLKLN
ncbi:MAG TPA: tripartite tricarboxylate transporter substrate-binding protein [Xanthobacteraceae bacterium]|nr:tripartite tricarboxylate transporter substrate-binding protein [Xanthobacteraceae bacterium]